MSSQSDAPWTRENKLLPLTREQLHEIAVRRRCDADVKALLLEIKRLHGVLARAHELAAFGTGTHSGEKIHFLDELLV